MISWNIIQSASNKSLVKWFSEKALLPHLCENIEPYQEGGSQRDCLAVDNLLDAYLTGEVVGNCLIPDPPSHVNNLKFQSLLLAIVSQFGKGLFQQFVSLLNEICRKRISNRFKWLWWYENCDMLLVYNLIRFPVLPTLPRFPALSLSLTSWPLPSNHLLLLIFLFTFSLPPTLSSFSLLPFPIPSFPQSSPTYLHMEW